MTTSRSPRVGRPPVTSRASILDAARRIIARDGWERLSIRRLSAELGIGATTLYHHVRDREDLLIQLINDHVERTLTVDLPSEPRERVVVAALAVHDTLAELPWAAEVLTVDGFLARLDAPAVGLVDAIVSGALECGTDRVAAVHVFRSIWYYTVGEILVRRSSGRSPTDPQPPREAYFGRVAAERVPHLAYVGEELWREVSAQDQYEEGLRSLVEGLLGRSG